MSMITNSQALDFERRLSVLENRVGTARQRKDENFQTVHDRLAVLRTDLEGKATTSTIKTNEMSWKDIQKLLKELDPGIALTHQQQPLLYKRQQVLASSDELARDFRELDKILKLLLSGTKANGSERGSSEPQGSSSSTKPSSSSKQISPNKMGQSSSSSPQKQKQQQMQSKKEQEQKTKQQQQQEQRPRSSGSTLRLDQVTQAPILTQHMASTAIQPSQQKRVENLREKILDLNERTKTLHSDLRHFLECYHTTTMAVSEKIILADERISAAAAATSS